MFTMLGRRMDNSGQTNPVAAGEDEDDLPF